ncbi:MAG: DUF2232 domain-containing protein [Bacillota bacterium]
METKELIEGALLTALVTIIIIIGFFLPMVGNFLLIISPLPIIAAVIRWNSRLGIITSLLSGIILFILINPGFLLFAFFYTGLLGVTIGAAFDDGFKPKAILAVGTIAASVAFSLNFFVVKYILDINILEQLEKQITIATQSYEQLGFSSEAMNQISVQLIDTLKITFPTLILCSGLLIALINYYFTTKVLTKLEFDYPYQLEVEKFKLHRFLLPVYLLAVFLSTNPIFHNLYMLITFLFFLEGLSVVYYYYLNKNISKLYFILAALLLPLAINFLFFVGIIDLWFDFRNLDDA